jgi:osmotically-inducible protein OsmY
MSEDQTSTDTSLPVDPPAKDVPPHGDTRPDTKPTEPVDTTDWKAEARKHEKRAKDNHAALEKAHADIQAEQERVKAILKAAGIGDDEDPAEAAKRTTAERDQAAQRAAQLEADLKAERRERAAERAARKAGANVDALLDSRGFVKALADLGDDASDKDITKAVEAALDAHPHLKAAPATPARSVTDTKGSPGESPKRSRSLSEAVTRAFQPQ